MTAGSVFFTAGYLQTALLCHSPVCLKPFMYAAQYHSHGMSNCLAAPRAKNGAMFQRYSVSLFGPPDVFVISVPITSAPQSPPRCMLSTLDVWADMTPLYAALLRSENIRLIAAMRSTRFFGRSPITVLTSALRFSSESRLCGRVVLPSILSYESMRSLSHSETIPS